MYRRQTSALSFASSGNLIADRRYDYAQSLISEKDYAAAIDLLEQTSELTPEWPPIWFTLGEAYQQLHQTEQAIKAFERTQSLDPKDQLGAGLRLSQLGDNAKDQAMSQSYVAALFDQYADRFDDHLTKALHYQGPEILFSELQNFCLINKRQFHFEKAVDLGCGTGLMAAKLIHHVDHFIGIDLSEQMILHAQKSGYYTETHCADIMGYLVQKPSRSFDLLIAADVLVYVGSLSGIFNEAKRVLAKNGLFAFTVQAHEGNHFRLGHDLRYHHSMSYIKNCAKASNLGVKTITSCVTRHDAGQPVPGFVVLVGAQI
jgi:predicted TPR repeat methyltransferase